jgi:hypothetical protein
MKERSNKRYYKIFLCEAVKSSIQTDVSIYRLEDIQQHSLQ